MHKVLWCCSTQFYMLSLYFTGADCPVKKVDILFLLDNSGTLEYAFKLARKFVKKILGLFPFSHDGTRASVITIGGPRYTHLAIRFSDYYENDAFNTAIDNIGIASGKTRIDMALKIAVNEAFLVRNGARPNVPKLIFFVSDGRQEPKVIDGKYVNFFSLTRPLSSITTNIVSIAVLGIHPVDIGVLQIISKNSDNVYSPGKLDTILSDIFARHAFNKYCTAMQPSLGSK